MSIVTEFMIVIFYCLVKLVTNHKLFIVTLAVAVVLAALLWLFCSYYTSLWNKQFRLNAFHHVLCAIAAFFTILFTLLFVSLQYNQEIAKVLIDTWKNFEIKGDDAWQKQTFRKAYEAIKEQNIEDLSNYPHPDQGGQLFPSSHQKTREITALIYAGEAGKHFQAHHPYLSKILWTKLDIPTQVIRQDHDDFFDNASKGGIYPLDRAINLAVERLTEGLSEQIPQIVTLSRAIVVVLFFIIQSILFGFIGYAAYKDIKIII